MNTERECKWCRPWKGKHEVGCSNRPPTYASMKLEKHQADAHSTMAEAQEEYDRLNNPDFVEPDRRE